MSAKRASATVPMATEDLFAWLCHVENWPRFMAELDEVEPLGHRRYRWSVRFAKHAREVDVVLSVDPHQHRIAWKHLHGAPFDGTIRLTPVSESRCRVDLQFDVEPQGFVEGVIDAFGSAGAGGWTAQRDLQRLCDLAHERSIGAADRV